MKGINATKVLDEKKQVYFNVSVLMNDQSLCFSAVCRSEDCEETDSTVLHLLRERQGHDFQEAEISLEELEASTQGRKFNWIKSSVENESGLSKKQTEDLFQTVPGVDFMIGGKDTCNVRTNCPSRIFGIFPG